MRRFTPLIRLKALIDSVRATPEQDKSTAIDNFMGALQRDPEVLSLAASNIHGELSKRAKELDDLAKEEIRYEIGDVGVSVLRFLRGFMFSDATEGKEIPTTVGFDDVAAYLINKGMHMDKEHITRLIQTLDRLGYTTGNITESSLRMTHDGFNALCILSE